MIKKRMENRFIKHSKFNSPSFVVRYPCSNPELVAAASEGGIAVTQPVS